MLWGEFGFFWVGGFVLGLVCRCGGGGGGGGGWCSC